MGELPGIGGADPANKALVDRLVALGQQGMTSGIDEAFDIDLLVEGALTLKAEDTMLHDGHAVGEG